MRKAFAAMAEVDPDGNWGQLGPQLAGIFDQIRWAGEEVEAARVRHPGRSRLNGEGVHELLQPTFTLMREEPTYRAHCRELLDRIAAGEDTRLGTDAEMCCVFAEFSPHNHITRAAELVYLRAFERLHPGRLPENADIIKSLEYSERYEADQAEKGLRRKLTVKGRALPYRPAKWQPEELPNLLESVREEIEGAA